MSRYGIDAATLVHLVDQGLVVHASHQLVAPSRIRSEALELLLKDVRAGARDERDALAAHERMTGLRIRALGDRVSRGTAWRLACEQGWDGLRDAEHVAVVRLQADALVTVDAELAKRAEGLVPLAPVEALLQP